MSELLKSMQPGDEIRSFASASHTWQKRTGRRGYAIVRTGRVVKAILTALN